MKLNKWTSILLVFLIGAMTVIGLSGLIFLVPKTSDQDENTSNQNNSYNQKANMENVNIQTSDGVSIVGDYYTPSGKIKGWVLYLHMMPSTKESYSQIAQRMQRVGYVGLAIDFRGHGKSQDGPDGYKDFNNENQQNSINDVLASIKFLKDKGALDGSISIVGASIGANLAIQYASQNTNINRIVALSPGLNYYGIMAGVLISELTETQNLFLVASGDDTNVPGNDKQVESMASISDIIKPIVKIYDNGGHGTDIIKINPDLEDDIVAFIVQ